MSESDEEYYREKGYDVSGESDVLSESDDEWKKEIIDSDSSSDCFDDEYCYYTYHPRYYGSYGIDGNDYRSGREQEKRHKAERERRTITINDSIEGTLRKYQRVGELIANINFTKLARFLLVTLPPNVVCRILAFAGCSFQNRNILESFQKPVNWCHFETLAYCVRQRLFCYNNFWCWWCPSHLSDYPSIDKYTPKGRSIATVTFIKLVNVLAQKTTPYIAYHILDLANTTKPSEQPSKSKMNIFTNLCVPNHWIIGDTIMHCIRNNTIDTKILQLICDVPLIIFKQFHEKIKRDSNVYPAHSTVECTPDAKLSVIINDIAYWSYYVWYFGITGTNGIYAQKIMALQEQNHILKTPICPDDFEPFGKCVKKRSASPKNKKKKSKNAKKKRQSKNKSIVLFRFGIGE